MLTSRVTFDSPYYDFSPSSESDKNEGEAQLVELSIEKPGAILTRVRVPGAAMDFFTLFFFAQRQLPVQTVLRCPYSPRVQSHASTSVRTLQTPYLDNHASVWTHENAAHTNKGG